MASEGCVYRRCGCVDPVIGRQLGGRCPRLAGSRHGSWLCGWSFLLGSMAAAGGSAGGGYASSKAAAAMPPAGC